MNKAQRKLKRRIEAEAYAKDARYWRGKIKSADRMGYDRPVDRQARNSTAGCRRANPTRRPGSNP